MKKSVLLIGMLVVCSAVAQCSTTDWQWKFGQGYFAYFGTSSTALDDADDLDALIQGAQYFYYGTYHENGVSGWTGTTGFYSKDLRAPLPLVPGVSENWTFYLWGDPSHIGHLEMMWGWSQPASPAFAKMRYVLTYVRSAVGVTTGSLPVGTSVVLNVNQQGTWSFPSYNTLDGRTGYKFTLTATVIPEPSSLAALLTGLAGLGAVLRRRRG